MHPIFCPNALPSSGDGNDLQFPRPRDLDLIQSTPLETLSLKTPPRVLTLNERPLDFLEEEQRAAPNSDEVVSDEAGYSVLRWKEEPHRILPLSHSNSVFHVSCLFALPVAAAPGSITAGTLGERERRRSSQQPAGSQRFHVSTVPVLSP